MGRIPKVDKERALEAAARRESFQEGESPDCNMDSGDDEDLSSGDGHLNYDDAFFPPNHTNGTEWLRDDRLTVPPHARLPPHPFPPNSDALLQSSNFPMFSNSNHVFSRDSHGRPVFPLDPTSFAAGAPPGVTTSSGRPPPPPLNSLPLLEQRIYDCFKDGSPPAQMSHSVGTRPPDSQHPPSIGEHLQAAGVHWPTNNNASSNTHKVQKRPFLRAFSHDVPHHLHTQNSPSQFSVRTPHTNHNLPNACTQSPNGASKRYYLQGAGDAMDQDLVSNPSSSPISDDSVKTPSTPDPYAPEMMQILQDAIQNGSLKSPAHHRVRHYSSPASPHRRRRSSLPPFDFSKYRLSDNSTNADAPPPGWQHVQPKQEPDTDATHHPISCVFNQLIGNAATSVDASSLAVQTIKSEEDECAHAHARTTRQPVPSE